MTTPTATIKIITPSGEIKDKQVRVVVAYTGSPLAITASAHNPNSYVITHLLSGRRIGPSHPDQGELTQLLERLIELPWSNDPTEAIDPTLLASSMAIYQDWINCFGLPTSETTP